MKLRGGREGPSEAAWDSTLDLVVSAGEGKYPRLWDPLEPTNDVETGWVEARRPCCLCLSSAWFDLNRWPRQRETLQSVGEGCQEDVTTSH